MSMFAKTYKDMSDSELIQIALKQLRATHTVQNTLYVLIAQKDLNGRVIAAAQVIEGSQSLLADDAIALFGLAKSTRRCDMHVTDKKYYQAIRRIAMRMITLQLAATRDEVNPSEAQTIHRMGSIGLQQLGLALGYGLPAVDVTEDLKATLEELLKATQDVLTSNFKAKGGVTPNDQTTD